tara:strand:+ start:3982 stop:4347 length:366 start_codon:yes stop_codon:yes gene_type:complete
VRDNPQVNILAGQALDGAGSDSEKLLSYIADQHCVADFQLFADKRQPHSGFRGGDISVQAAVGWMRYLRGWPPRFDALTCNKKPVYVCDLQKASANQKSYVDRQPKVVVCRLPQMPIAERH